MGYGISIRIAAPFAEGTAHVRDPLKAQGIGVLTEVDRLPGTRPARLRSGCVNSAARLPGAYPDGPG